MKLSHKKKIAYAGGIIAIATISFFVVHNLNFSKSTAKIHEKKLQKTEQSLEIFQSQDFTLSNQDGSVQHTILQKNFKTITKKCRMRILKYMKITL